MAMKEQYYTVDGQMLGYKSGGNQKDFLSDSLGSVTAEVDQTQAKTYEGRYKPSGEVLSKVGSPGPYTWIGTFGYRLSRVDYSEVYVRSRHISNYNVAWTTVDKKWPKQSPYGYVAGQYTTVVDESGMGPGKCENCAASLYALWSRTDTHYCCHAFIHCMTCCILGHEFDVDCAVLAQNKENERMHHNKDQSQGLMEICKFGAKGTSSAYFGAHCISKYSQCGGKDTDPRCKHEYRINKKGKKMLDVWDMDGVPVHPGIPLNCYNASPLCKALIWF